MIPITRVDHIGIRVLDLERSLKFYKILGFELTKNGFDRGGPAVLHHPIGVVLNLLGPSHPDHGLKNILMDEEKKHTGYTHVAINVSSIEETARVLKENNLRITEGPVERDRVIALFVRDPDSTVIELTQPRQ